MDGVVLATMIGGLLGFLASVVPKVLDMATAHMERTQNHRQEAQRIDAAQKGVVPPGMIPMPNEGECPAPGIPPNFPPPPFQQCEPIQPEPPPPPPPMDVMPPRQEEHREERHESLNKTASDNDLPDVDDTDGFPFWLRFFATMRVSIRPVITYAFFGLFVLIKLQAMWHGMFDNQTPIVQLLPIIWDEGSASLFAAILAFWFGTRAFDTSRTFMRKA
jgi:hypothetical protein